MTPRRPSIREEAGGLLSAIAAARAGDTDALMAWYDRASPVVVEALVRVGVSRSDARHLVHRLVTEAFLTDVKGNRVSNERAWMSDRLRQLQVRRLHARPAHEEPLGDVDPAGDEDPTSDLEHRDHVLFMRERIVAAAMRLPPPYREIILLQGLYDFSREEIHTYLSQVRTLSMDAVRAHIRKARRMLRVALAGEDPRERWPQTYDPRKNPWIDDPPPPVPLPQETASCSGRSRAWPGSLTGGYGVWLARAGPQRHRPRGNP